VGVVEFPVDAVVPVHEELLPLVLEVPVLDRDVALAEGGEDVEAVSAHRVLLLQAWPGAHFDGIVP
jgi:hypothetical protein